MLPSCTLKPDDHSICISAMFAHKQIHLTRRVKGLYVAAISSVNQSMKSSKRQYLMKSNSKLSLRTRIFVSKSSILRPAATIFPQYATCSISAWNYLAQRTRKHGSPTDFLIDLSGFKRQLVGLVGMFGWFKIRRNGS